MSEARRTETLKLLNELIKSCEQTLSSVTHYQIIIPARYILIKLFLMLKTERFGCGYVGKNRLLECQRLAEQIKI